jgi:hypothetical protein
MATNIPTGEMILCMAVGHTGDGFLEELANLGCQAVLLTVDEQRDAGWPSDAISELQSMPANMTMQQITNAVTYLARARKFARIIALDNINVEIAAALREHLRIPGAGITTARYFSDRLAARVKAARMGIAVPAFTSIANYDDLRHFMQAVPAPWLLTPRSASCDAESRQLAESEQVWRALDALGDHQSGFLLEQSIEGDRVYVDSLTAGGTVVFSAVSSCRTVSARGNDAGELMPRAQKSSTSSDIERLRLANNTLLSSMRMARGATHTEFIRSNANGEYYFMEASATVDDRCVPGMMQETHGLNLWQEWAKLEVAAMRGRPYVLPANAGGRKPLPGSTEAQHRLA